MAVSMTPAMQAEIRILPGNDKCVDCGSNHPQWASVTYGALMCLECSGAHRGMGVHISFVRSVDHGLVVRQAAQDDDALVERRTRRLLAEA